MCDDAIAITGIGAVSSIGVSIEAFAGSLREGRAGITALRRFDPSPYSATKSFEISDFKLEGKKSRDLARINKGALYTIKAAREALAQSGFPVKERPYDVGLVLGSFFFDIGLVTAYLSDVLRSRLTDYRPLFFPNTVPNATAAHTAIDLKIKGPNISLVNKQNGAFTALEYAVRMLKNGHAKMALAVGVDYLSYESFLYFHQLGRLAGTRGEESHVPFSAGRNGFILGEGCGVLALEKLQDAQERKADIVAVVRGIAGMSFPCPVNEYLSPIRPSVARLYDGLLKAGGLGKESIEAFISCANSSVDIDAWEDRAISSYFGNTLPITSLSSFIGEVSDGAMLQIIAACLCLKEGFLFPVLGYAPNPEMNSNILRSHKVFEKINAIMSSSIGMGGNYSAALLTRQ